MAMRRMLPLMVIAIALALSGIARGEPLIIELSVASDINPATASYTNRGIRAATGRGADLLLIKLDTAGGQMTSTRQITGDMLQSAVPVGIWVAPEGTRAASAGTFLVYAAHVSTMAPSPTIAAPHPLLMGAYRARRQATRARVAPANSKPSWERRPTTQSPRSAAWRRHGANPTTILCVVSGAIPTLITILLLWVFLVPA